MNIVRRLFFAFATALCCVAPSYAEDAPSSYPNRPIRIIAPFPPGTGIDIVARIVGEGLAQHYKQPVVVENRAGAGGNVGAEVAKNSVADGYTLLVISLSHVIGQTLYRDVKYDLVRDFVPLSIVGSNPIVLVVNRTVPVNSVADLIALAKGQPGSLNFASTGNGTSPHLSGEMFNQLAGVKTTHVPYRGGDALTDLVAGRTQFMFATLPSAIAFIKSGQLKALAVTTRERHPTLASVPTMNETLPGFDVPVWLGIVVRAGTPQRIASNLHSALVSILKKPEIRDKLHAQGIDAQTNSQEEFKQLIRSDIDKWEKVIRASDTRIN